MLFEAKQKIVFIGDSITDADRQTTAPPYGNGYVSMIRNFLVARYPELNLVIVNKGLGGNTIRDLDQRWENDVIAERPNWLSVCIGINDVWRHFDGNSKEAVPLDEYLSTLRRLLKRAQDATGAQLILAEPYMIEKDPNNLMHRLMDLYGQSVDSMATDLKATLVRTQAAFDAALASTSPADWASDHIPSQRRRPRGHRPGVSANVGVRSLMPDSGAA
jgi:lysophospholipase L1-like esterase